MSNLRKARPGEIDAMLPDDFAGEVLGMCDIAWSGWEADFAVLLVRHPDGRKELVRLGETGMISGRTEDILAERISEYRRLILQTEALLDAWNGGKGEIHAMLAMQELAADLSRATDAVAVLAGITASEIEALLAGIQLIESPARGTAYEMDYRRSLVVGLEAFNRKAVVGLLDAIDRMDIARHRLLEALSAPR
ncbi:hypothetical protein [Devosia sp. 1566]|uniref:hypothetical protein n=1 Tax=Devosia sp. 1566 TaxID=2499144 RepID=UPI000FD9DCE0|nr:hypothetical protein [Devosia sp. 1566]